MSSMQIAMISPGFNCCEHTLNTLRYADRFVHKTRVLSDDLKLYNYLFKLSLFSPPPFLLPACQLASVPHLIHLLLPRLPLSCLCSPFTSSSLLPLLLFHISLSFTLLPLFLLLWPCLHSLLSSLPVPLKSERAAIEWKWRW